MALPVIHLERAGQQSAFTGWSGEVNTFANLPLATASDGQFWMVLNPTGSRFLFTYKASGLYLAESGSWRKINNAQLLLNDAQFSVYNSADNTKQISFDVASITTGTRRTATWPDKDGVVAMSDDVITSHNSLSGLQGGIVGEYYHLTLAELTSVQSILKQKSGISLASSFSGNPKKTSAIVFATPFPSANYSVVVTAHTQNNTTFSIDYEARTATGFVINTHVNNINNLIDVTWIASQIGEN